MMDVVYLGAMVGFFAICVLYAHAFGKIRDIRFEISDFGFEIWESLSWLKTS